jgi:serine protease AprX
MKTLLSFRLTLAAHALLLLAPLAAQQPAPWSDAGGVVEHAELLTIPGGAARVAIWSETSAGGRVERYAIAPDGGDFLPARDARTELMLRHGVFDPLRDGAPRPLSALAAPAAARLFVVQFRTQTLEDYRALLRGAGAEPRLFLPWQAEVYEMDPVVAAAVATLPFVRWVGPFLPEYKLDETLLEAFRRGAPPTDARLRLNVLSTVRGPAGQQPVLRLAAALGAEVFEFSPETHLLAMEIDFYALPRLVASDAVQWVDFWSAPEQDMDLARQFHGATFLESVAGYTGAGVRVEVMDGGCDVGHPDLVNHLLHGTNTPDAHGTCTSGIVAGSGAGNAAARGVMPDALLIVADYSYYSGGSRYAHSAELQNPALPYRAVLQSNSWGGARTRSYTSVSQNMDLILFDQQRLSILQSQSNAGNQDSRPEAWAKNVISVGGVYHYNTLSKTDDRWNSGGSIGPAADGRIKPDVASFYDATLCTDMVGTAGYASGNYYSSFGGTSGATPITAGHLGLIYELWADAAFGNAAPGATVFDDRPHNTTAKALLINTASQWTFSGSSHDLTRTHQGWGHADLANAWDLRNAMLIVDESDVLANLQSKSYSVSVAAGTPALKATMVFRDPPGTTSSVLHRINDLDLKVTAPGGTVYWGNQGLLAAMWSAPGGAPNTVDTVENVFVQNPTAGDWTIEVIAAELNQDAHVETGALDADYALVVSGVGPAGPPQPPAAPSGLDAAAASSSRIDVTWSDNSNNEAGFELESSPDGASWAPLATLPADAVSHADVGLTANTTRHYRVRGFNAAGASGWSNVDAATTLPPGPVDDVANGESRIAGTVAGAYSATHAGDAAYQTITEVESGGSPRTRYSWLEHRWSVDVTGGAAVEVRVRAHRTPTSENESFTFAWSPDGAAWTTMFQVVKNADDGNYQSFALPPNVSGTIWIRVTDSDRTAGKRKKDAISVNHLLVRSMP